MTTKQADYQTLNSRLEAVLAQLQAPDVYVGDAVQLYEEGLKLVAELEAYLSQAENKVEHLRLKNKEG